jgi:hypothetical protein
VSQLPADLIAGLGVTAATPIGGGDIACAFRLDAAGALFAETLEAPRRGLFPALLVGVGYGRAALDVLRRS